MNSFPFLEVYLNDMEAMPEELQMIYLKAVLNYGLKGVVPEFDNFGLSIAFSHARRLIDAGRAQRESSRENGAKGGRPKKEKTVAENDNPDETQNNPDITQENPSITQNNLTITQKNPSITQENPEVTQNNPAKPKEKGKVNIESKSESENIREIEKQMEILKALTPSTKKIPLSEALNNNTSISP